MGLVGLTLEKLTEGLADLWRGLDLDEPVGKTVDAVLDSEQIVAFQSLFAAFEHHWHSTLSAVPARGKLEELSRNWSNCSAKEEKLLGPLGRIVVLNFETTNSPTSFRPVECTCRFARALWPKEMYGGRYSLSKLGWNWKVIARTAPAMMPH